MENFKNLSEKIEFLKLDCSAISIEKFSLSQLKNFHFHISTSYYFILARVQRRFIHAEDLHRNVNRTRRGFARVRDCWIIVIGNI